MRVPETLTELLIFAREHGADELPEAKRCLESAECHIERLAAERTRRAGLRRRDLCIYLVKFQSFGAKELIVGDGTDLAPQSTVSVSRLHADGVAAAVAGSRSAESPGGQK